MTVYQALRRRILTPSDSATKLDVRGFHVKGPESRALLETIGQSFLTGYGHAAYAQNPAAAEADLEGIPTRFRGFAYEGAAMAFAIRDGLPFGRSHFVKEFLAGRGDAHIYMAYVGLGWAMARLPRVRWSTLHMPDPVLRWLVLDGYGFHQAYFRTERYVYDMVEEDVLPWRGDAGRSYARRAIDQGIGRALWFVGGTDVEVVARLIDRYPLRRRADLYSGAGLAATYAGGAGEAELTAFCQHAAGYRAQIAQGAAFAAGARVRADLVVPHNEIATQVFCGMPVALAKKMTDEALVDLPPDGQVPAYEVWRQRIANSFVPRGE